MKNKRLLKRINNFVNRSGENHETHKFIKGTFHFTENPVNYDDRYYGMKYFFCYDNTYTVIEAFKTQAELDEFLREYGF